MGPRTRGLWLAGLLLGVGCTQSALGGGSSGGSGSSGLITSTSTNGASGNSGRTTSTTAQNTNTGGTSQTTGATTAGSTSGVTTSGTVSSSSATSTTNSNCTESGGNSPSLSCARPPVDGGDILASEAVEIDCTVGSGEAPVRFEVATSPAFTTVDTHDLLTTGQTWVTLVPAMLPATFPDSLITATITVHFCDAAPSSTTVSWPVLGNTLVADKATSVRSFASDGTEVTPFLGPTQVAGPSLIMQLSDGSFLAGCSTGTQGCTHALQTFSPAGSLLTTFDDTDHSNNPLWPTTVRPWAAAQDPNGDIWVSGYVGQDQAGILLIFTSSGGYVATATKPTDPTQTISWWTPMGIAQLSDGSMVVAMGGASGDQVALVRYANADPGQPIIVPLGWDNCTDPGTGVPSCTQSSFEDGDAAGLLSVNGRLLVSTAFGSTAQVLSYNDPSLTISGGSAIPTTGVNDLSNDYLAQIVPFGSGFLVASNFSYGCIYRLGGRTLYPPSSLNAQSGCWLSNGGLNITLEGLWHITGS